MLRQVRVMPLTSVATVAAAWPAAGWGTRGVPRSLGPVGLVEPAAPKAVTTGWLKAWPAKTGAAGVIGTSFSIQMPVLALKAASWLLSTSIRIWRNWLRRFAQ